MKLSRRILRSPRTIRAMGVLAGEYLRLVWNTSRVVLIDPPDIYERIEAQQPLILAMWHGQHFMMPFIKKHHRAKVLISRHRDGEVNAVAAERFGVGTVRGSGDQGGRFDIKGGVGAFKGMLDALDEGYNMALTADVPKISRVAGAGIVKLAQFSGRPIYPVAVASSRRIELKNWDRSAVNLPFSKLAFVVADPILVPDNLDDAGVEAYRAKVKQALDDATARAYAAVDRGDAHARQS